MKKEKGVVVDVPQRDPKQSQSSFSNMVVEILLLCSVGGYFDLNMLDHLSCSKASEITPIGLLPHRCTSVVNLWSAVTSFCRCIRKRT